MTSLDQWQRMTPKQQWDAFNALQNAQAVSAKANVVKQLQKQEQVIADSLAKQTKLAEASAKRQLEALTESAARNQAATEAGRRIAEQLQNGSENDG